MWSHKTQMQIGLDFHLLIIRVFKNFPLTYYKGNTINTKILNSLGYKMHCYTGKAGYLNTEGKKPTIPPRASNHVV